MLNAVKVKKLRADAVVPVRATEGSSGYDVRACIDEPIVLEVGRRHIVGTGIALEMSDMLECQVRPRSGLAAKHGVTVLNAPGTIDSDYRGEVCVVLINHGSEPYVVHSGDRIAQLVFDLKFNAGYLVEVDDIDGTTVRGAGGFGSTGV